MTGHLELITLASMHNITHLAFNVFLVWIARRAFGIRTGFNRFLT